MRQMYLILSIVGWAWLGLAAVVLPIRWARLRRVERQRGFPIEPVQSGGASDANPQAVNRP